MDSGAGAAGGMVLLIVILILYFIPSVVATCRKHHNCGAILVVNLFFGWTFLGWVIALVWAFTNPPSERVVVINNNAEKAK